MSKYVIAAGNALRVTCCCLQYLPANVCSKLKTTRPEDKDILTEHHIVKVKVEPKNRGCHHFQDTTINPGQFDLVIPLN